MADGSVIRSLSGRSALLGDGYSRNPKDRDALIAQRTKDLEGAIGQARAFDLDEFLSDWEPTDGRPIPWTLPAHAVPAPPGPVAALERHGSPTRRAPPRQVALCTVPASSPGGAWDLVDPSITRAARSWMRTQDAVVQAGIMPKLTVLYVPDYVAPSVRLTKSAHLWRILVTMLPGYEISVPVAGVPSKTTTACQPFSIRARAP